MFDLYLPNRKALTDLFLPRPGHVPDSAILRILGFAFTGPTVVGPLATAQQTIQMQPSFLLWALAGVGDQNEGFSLDLVHSTPSGERHLVSKVLPQNIVVGTAQLPLMLTEPYLMQRGDSLRCLVKNGSAAANQNIWVALWGCDVEVPQ